MRCLLRPAGCNINAAAASRSSSLQTVSETVSETVSDGAVAAVPGVCTDVAGGSRIYNPWRRAVAEAALQQLLLQSSCSDCSSYCSSSYSCSCWSCSSSRSCSYWSCSSSWRCSRSSRSRARQHCIHDEPIATRVCPSRAGPLILGSSQPPSARAPAGSGTPACRRSRAAAALQLPQRRPHGERFGAASTCQPCQDVAA